MESAEAFESLGKYLKATRESLKLSLKEVADVTRIREPVLRALEEDRYVNLSPFYLKSFLSAYAGCLGLDPNEVITAHQRFAEKLSFPKDRVLQTPFTIRRKRSNVRLLVISFSAVLLIALLAYLFIELSR